jgi:hypothetical protein
MAGNLINKTDPVALDSYYSYYSSYLFDIVEIRKGVYTLVHQGNYCSVWDYDVMRLVAANYGENEQFNIRYIRPFP